MEIEFSRKQRQQRRLLQLERKSEFPVETARLRDCGDVRSGRLAPDEAMFPAEISVADANAAPEYRNAAF